MNCLVVAATAREIEPFIGYVRQHPDHLPVDVLVTGVGLTATTYAMMRQIMLKRPAVVVQAGIAGSFDRNILPSSVVVIKRDMIADESVIENGRLKTMFDLGLNHPDQFPYQKGWLVNPHGPLLKKAKLPMVDGLSVNQVTTGSDMIHNYEAKFNAAIESMEGAAFHYVCLQENLPFLQLRAVSNHVGQRDKTKWKIGESVANLNKELIRVVNTIQLRKR